MSDRTRSAAGRILSELYREDDTRREQPEPLDAPEGSRADRREADDDGPGERAA